MVFIVVESFNDWAIGKIVNGHRITPVIDSLCRQKGMIYAPRMLSQVHSGVSSDGQFIYNTGLYPSSEVTTIVSYGGNRYNSLAKRLGDHYSFEVIGESASLWNHSQTTMDYHYARLIDNANHRAKLEQRGRDEVIFEETLNVIDTVARPFYAFVTTISMHGPYEDPGVQMEPWLREAKLPEMLRKYYNVTHYFDKSLGRFLDKLGRGMADNPPLIVIAADHKAKVDGAQVDYRDYTIPLLMLNTPYTLRIDHPIGQVDVMPTILALMGKKTDGCMGLPLFNKNLRGAVNSEGDIKGGKLSPVFVDMLRRAEKTANTLLRCDLAEGKNVDKHSGPCN